MTSRQMALCGVLSALAVTALLLCGLMPAATFCGPLLAMAALLPVLEECGPKAAGTAYAAAALLGLLLTADREAALVYLFFGWYPVLRPRIAVISSQGRRILTKLAVCSGTAFLLYGLAMGALGLPPDLGGPGLNAVLLLLGNAVFLMMDFALARLTVLWRRKLRRQFFRGD